MLYYGTRLSENISIREPEGYLLCLNVPVARTGTQEYLPEELGISSDSTYIEVLRPEEEVFSDAAIASFEGMPVTNDHPRDSVDIDNIRQLQKGHAHNIRRGTGEESDLLLADLIITDPYLIDLILNQNKREISCGYNYELCEEDGHYIQRQIRGNHVAVVDAGRAGHRVCIKDHKPERRKSRMKKSLYKKLARMARDGDPEAIEALAEAVEEIVEGAAPEEEAVVVAAATEPEAEPAAAETVVADPAVVVETPEGAEVAVDDEPMMEIISRLDRIIELLTPAAPAAVDEDPVDEIASVVEEALETAVEAESSADPELAEAAQEVAEVIEEVADPLSEVIQPEDCGPQNNNSTDAVRAALTAMRPALANMSKAQRKKIGADIVARLKKQKATDGRAYAAIAARARKSKTDISDLGKRIMEKRNPNYSK